MREGMAASLSPGRDSTAGTPYHHRSPTPPPPPPMGMPNKREVRRHKLIDRVQELSDSFSRNRDVYWRQQLHALQIDMGLILRADPYQPRPLEDMGDEITDLVETASGRGSTNNFDISPLAGRWYARFVEKINNAQEERDSRLAQLMNDHKRRLEFLEFECKWKVDAAVEEHRLLSNSIRERLANALSQKRLRLLKEKGHLDIAESNAFLLHPSQFSYTNPASPGGGSSNRKTRHTRHMRDVDDFGTMAAADSAYRKRRKAMREDENGSDRSNKNGDDSQSSYTGPPLFSIDKLFTDKELMMTSATASGNALAAIKRDRGAHDGSIMGVSGRHIDGDDVGGSSNGDDNEEGTPAATEMDRILSHSHHATRSARPSGPQALQLLGDMPEGLPSSQRHSTFNLTASNSRNLSATEVSSASKQEEEDDFAAFAMAESKLYQAVGGAAMNRQSSFATHEASTPMKRTASGAGLGNGEGGKRSRRR